MNGTHVGLMISVIAVTSSCLEKKQIPMVLSGSMPQVLRPDGLYQIHQWFSLYRWHVKDLIRFTSDLQVDVQALGWMRNEDGKSSYYLQREDGYLSVAYFYLDRPTTVLPERSPMRH